MVTRNDVAKRAKVAPCVVSYVLNNSNYVSEEKREAVLKAVKELKYVPNQVAQNLKNNRTLQFAVVRGSTLNDMFNDLLYSLEKFALINGYTVSLMTVARDEKKMATEAYIDMLIGRKFDAIFIANSSMTEKQINKLASRNIPILLYTTHDYEGLDENVRYLAPDYRQGIEKLIDFLIDQGHERIAFMPNMLYPNPLCQTNHRFSGYFNALKKHGIPLVPEYIGDESETIEDIKRNIAKLFDRSKALPLPTALYLDESVVVGVVMKELEKLGFRVPEDVSIVSSSDSTVASILTPALTDVGVDTGDLAQKAVDMMMDIISGKRPEHCLIPMDLFVRESTRTLK